MKIIFIGPPGSGKTTQAEIIAKKLKIPLISLGNLLREYAEFDNIYSKKLKEIMEKGNLVPNEIAIAIFRDRIEKKDCKNGFVIDGFPRDMEELEAVEKKIKIDKVFYLELSEKEIIRRLSSRFECEKCGEVYNINTKKTKKPGICDKCGGKLIQRKDDKPEIIKKRLKVYHKETEPLLKKFKNKKILTIIDASGNIQEVARRILKTIKD